MSADVDAARAALLSWLPADCMLRGASHTHNGRCPAEAHVALDALIAAVRAEQLAVCGQWHRDAEAKLAALDAAIQKAQAKQYTAAYTQGLTDARRILAATPAEDGEYEESKDDWQFRGTR